jgi:diaminopimelate decarboxylase
LVFEPGRFLVGNAGVLVTRVLYVKEGASRRFVIVDAAMNDLLRPALYDGYHAIMPVMQPAEGAPMQPVDVVGPICESSDTFATQRPLPRVIAGDLLAICSAGAYGAVMSSAYNTRPPAAEVMVRGAAYAVVRPRLDLDALIGQDRLPDWLATDDRRLAGARPRA